MAYPGGIAPVAMAVTDLNGDGKADVMVVNNGSAAVSALLGNGDGTLLPLTSYGAGGNPHSLALADFNLDGKIDAAVVTSDNLGLGDEAVAVLLGNGDGSFQPKTEFGTGGDPRQCSRRF